MLVRVSHDPHGDRQNVLSRQINPHNAAFAKQRKNFSSEFLSLFEMDQEFQNCVNMCVHSLFCRKTELIINTTLLKLCWWDYVHFLVNKLVVFSLVLYSI